MDSDISLSTAPSNQPWPTDPLSPPETISLLTGFTLMVTVAMLMLLGSVWAGFGLSFTLTLGLIALLLPMLLAIRASHWLSHQPQWPWPLSRRTPWLVGSSIGLATGLLMLFLGWFWAQWFDLSWDSLYYHKELVMQLAWGWNPYADAVPPRDYFPLTRPYINLDYISHASHALELVGAVFYSWTQQIESGKAVNSLILLGSGFLAYPCMGVLLRPLRQTAHHRMVPIVQGVLAFNVACNPISLAQISILYTDGVITSLLITLLVCGTLVLVQEPKPWHGLCVFPTLLMVVAIKLTGIFFSIIFIAIGLLWLWRRKKHLYWRSLGGLALCYVVSITLISANPYITDLYSWLPHATPEVQIPNQPDMPAKPATLNPEKPPEPGSIGTMRPRGFHHPPLYERIMDKQSAPAFLAQPSLIKFIQSINASPYVGITHIPPLRNPFRVSSLDWIYCRYPDVRIGGLGPLFPIAFWLSLLALPWFFRHRTHPIIQAIGVCLGAMIIGVAVFPESWWLRFVGFFCLWPMLITVGLLVVPCRIRQQPVSMYLSLIIILVITLNSLGVGAIRLYADWDRSATVNQEIAQIRNMHLPFGLLAYSGAFYSFRFIPYEHGIPFHPLLSPCPANDHSNQPVTLKGETFQLRQFPYFYNTVCYLEAWPQESADPRANIFPKKKR